MEAKKKNILILSYSYPPSNSPGVQRAYSIAKYLDKCKFNVTVITCDNPKTPLGINLNFNPDLEGVRLIKIKSILNTKISGKKRETKLVNTKRSFTQYFKKLFIDKIKPLIFPDFGITWTPKVKQYLINEGDLIRNCDVIITSSPGVSNHQLGSFIKKRNPSPIWIADFRDFHYANNISYKKSFISYLHKNMEKKIVDQADILTFVTKSMRGAYQDFYPALKKKMHCIYNGYDRDDFKDFNVKSLGSGKMTIFYAGSFYKGLRSPFSLMKLLDKAFEDNILLPSEVLVKIAGSIDEDMIKQMSEYNSFQSIYFMGNIPRTEALEEMTNATFLWLIVADIPSHYQTVPAKIFEYIAARRPILNFSVKEAETFKIVEDMNLGTSFATAPFAFEKEYCVFKEIVSKFKAGEYQQPLPLDNTSIFLREEQTKAFESLI